MAAVLFGATALFAGTEEPESPQELACEEDLLQDLKTNITTVHGLVWEIREHNGEHNFNVEQQILLRGLFQVVFPKQDKRMQMALRKEDNATDNLRTFSDCHKEADKFVHAVLQNPCIGGLETMSQLKQAVDEQGRLVQKLKAKHRIASHPESAIPPQPGNPPVAEEGSLLQPESAGPSESSTATYQEECADIGPFMCSICTEEIQAKDVFIVSTCGHRLCMECAKKSVTHDLDHRNLPLVCPLCAACPCEKCPLKTGRVKHPKNLREGRCKFQDSDLEVVLFEDDMRLHRDLQVAYALKGQGAKFFCCASCGFKGQYPTSKIHTRCYMCPRCKKVSFVDILDRELAELTRPNRVKSSLPEPVMRQRAIGRDKDNNGTSESPTRGQECAESSDTARFAWDSGHVPGTRTKPSTTSRFCPGGGLHRPSLLDPRHAGNFASAATSAGQCPLSTPVNGNHCPPTYNTRDVQGQKVVPHMARPVTTSLRECEDSATAFISPCGPSESSSGHRNAQTTTRRVASNALEKVAKQLGSRDFEDYDPSANGGSMLPSPLERKAREANCRQSKKTSKDAEECGAGKPLREGEKAEENRERRAVEALQSQTHIRLPPKYKGDPSIVCVACLRLFVTGPNVPKMQVKALVHAGEQCAQGRTDIGFAFSPEAVCADNLDARDGTLVCRACQARVGTSGEYRRGEMFCCKCEHTVEQQDVGIDVLNNELEPSREAPFPMYCFHGKSIGVKLRP